ncbi:hypothetical protein EDB80DRAFT_675063 [Ilyonectria destructans]|nr:hypothetical protein EDB80DRAFT_675063 [Ilyonectria destructans]
MCKASPLTGLFRPGRLTSWDESWHERKSTEAKFIRGNTGIVHITKQAQSRLSPQTGCECRNRIAEQIMNYEGQGGEGDEYGCKALRDPVMGNRVSDPTSIFRPPSPKTRHPKSHLRPKKGPGLQNSRCGSLSGEGALKKRGTVPIILLRLSGGSLTQRSGVMTTRAAGIGIDRASAREGGRTLQQDRFLPVSTTETRPHPDEANEEVPLGSLWTNNYLVVARRWVTLNGDGSVSPT